MMRAGIMEKLFDVNETWTEMANNGDGNKTTRSALSRAVRGATKTTDWAIHQIDEFLIDELAWRGQTTPIVQQPVGWQERGGGPTKHTTAPATAADTDHSTTRQGRI